MSSHPAGVYRENIVGSNGETYRLSVAWCGEDPAEALVLTDADGLFGMAVDIVRMMRLPELVPALLVVGVGYAAAVEIADTIPARTRDLTPTGVGAFPGSGGSAAFRELVRTAVMPQIQELAPSVRRTTYFGHSLGGLFGVHDLLSAERLFDRHIISSPSLWWDGHELLSAAIPQIAGEAFLGIGGDETDEGRRREAAALADGHPFKPPPQHLDMVDDLRRFADRLMAGAGPDLRLETAVFEDEFHATVPPIVLTRGLRWLHREP